MHEFSFMVIFDSMERLTYEPENGGGVAAFNYLFNEAEAEFIENANTDFFIASIRGLIKETFGDSLYMESLELKGVSEELGDKDMAEKVRFFLNVKNSLNSSLNDYEIDNEGYVRSTIIAFDEAFGYLTND